jgi:hypothetical protein
VSSDAGEGSKEEGRDDRPEQLGRQQQEEEDLGQQQLPAVGAASQDYIVIPAGPTGASPDASGLFQAQNIATKVCVCVCVLRMPLLDVYAVCDTTDPCHSCEPSLAAA